MAPSLLHFSCDYHIVPTDRRHAYQWTLAPWNTLGFGQTVPYISGVPYIHGYITQTRPETRFQRVVPFKQMFLSLGDLITRGHCSQCKEIGAGMKLLL